MSTLFTIIPMKYNTIRPQDLDFTKQLRHIAQPPSLLYYYGKLPAARIKSVAIVGSRKPTAYGRAVTEKLVHTLAKYNVVIVSGLAVGIDGIAHRAALKYGTPTIGVLAHGLQEIYPTTHYALAKSIIKAGGAIISAYPYGTPAFPSNFLERNRIVSGLADVVVITEAAVRSGTLNTASHAIEQGREVFSVPGNINSSMSAGTNRLIRQGAQPLIEPTDVLRALGYVNSAKNSKKCTPPAPKRQDPTENSLVKHIQENPLSTDQLVQQTGLPPAQVFLALSTLEISGIIESDATGKWLLSP